MEYPILIENEPHLLRLIQIVVKATLKEQQPEKAPVFMSKTECYKRLKGRSILDRAIQNGNLPLHCIEGKAVVKAKEFEAWVNKSQI